MGYHHKHEECSKDTHQILENVIMIKHREYELLSSTPTVKVSSPTEDIIGEGSANVLRSRAERILDSEETAEVSVEHSEFPDADGMGTEYYKSPLKITFKIEETEAYIKKRKHSNKMNTDIDYSEC